MDKHEAKNLLRRVNELHSDIASLEEKKEELARRLKQLKDADRPAGLVRADFLESCGRYVFLDDLN